MVRLLFLCLCVILCTGASAQIRERIVLNTKSGKIYGTLTVPARRAAGLPPVVIIVPGTGPTDRDGNSSIMINNSHLLLSDSLAKRGIASLRFDKRGLAASKAAASEEKLLFPQYADDVAGWVKMLKRGKRFSRIFIAGHSEGALIGVIAANKVPVSGIISIAGPGKPADSAIMDQLQKMPDMAAGTLDTARQLFRQLREEGHVHDVPPSGFYQSMFRSSIQRYVYSWIKFHPAEEFRKLNVPVLIIQGTADLQVDTTQAHRLAAAARDARLLMIPGMNHVFRLAPQDNPAVNMATYYDKTLPIRTELVQGIARFISQDKKN